MNTGFGSALGQRSTLGHAAGTQPRPSSAGRPWPLGASLDAQGVNFALAAPVAEAVELCLFDASGQHELPRIAAQRHAGGVWHVHVAGLGAGALYGWRVHGPWNPALGQRCNPAKLLLDPYAREVHGHYDGSDLFLGHDSANPQRPDGRDNAGVALKARVVAEPEPLPEAAHVRVPLADTVLLELHVKNATMRHPGVDRGRRGTYAGLAHPEMLGHLKHLGITTVSLMPLHQRVDEARLLAQGLVNHWGYNPVAWMAPEARYAVPPGQDTLAQRLARGPGHALAECRAMVAALHAQGLEVVLDVVLNHSAELDEAGPTFHLRGMDNAHYHHLLRGQPRHYENHTGCGNTLNLQSSFGLRLAMDTLRFWAEVVGVDGFRFDLGPVLGRTEHGFSAQAPLFAAIAQDPVLARCKLIAEPWDIGPGGYRLGGFPAGFAEWNDRYRDTMRRFWLRRNVSRGEFAHALAGSSSLFAPSRRPPTASVNFITAHDGFTLADLVSYRERHNQANGEHNRDGHAHNHGCNAGVEGHSSDPAVQQQRQRLQRALLATLLCSLGTPMLLSGDELGHSQQGNNNAYCQDNETTWLHWDQADVALADFTARCVATRRQMRAQSPSGGQRWLAEGDVAWLTPEGQPLGTADWEDPADHALAVWLSPGAQDADQRRAGGHGPQWLLLVNAGSTPRRFTLPAGTRWQPLLRSDTGLPPAAQEALLEVNLEVNAHSLWLAQRTQ
jgi:glycogen operon protein